MLVTSFNKKGFEEYGRRFIESFLEHWKDEHLIAYHGGDIDGLIKHERVEYRRLEQIPGFQELEERLLESDPLYAGVMQGPKDEPAYNYRYDALKFFRKVFAITDAAKRTEGYLAWIDADCVVVRDVPEKFNQFLLPPSKFVAYLGRPEHYSECGFMVFNLDHAACSEFMRHYRGIYETGAFRLCGEWHDSWLFDLVRELLQPPEKNLAAGCDPSHPFVDSVLGRYIDHLKGPERKQLGKSPELKEVAA